MASLLSPSQLAAIQNVALTGMTDIVSIERPTLSDSIYGDNEDLTYVPIGTTRAWFRSTPTVVATADVGALVTINTYRLLVPVGTDIVPKDQIVFGADIYLVTDTTVESTWKPFLQVSLRRRE